MTLADIDTALADWESRLSSIAHNLFDLQNDPTYECLTGTGGAPRTQVTGVTAAKITPALEDVATLFRCFELLQRTIDRAVQLRGELPSLFGADQKIREIQQLLLGKSVRIPADRIPIAKRSLLSGADDGSGVSPDELLSTMMRAFESARDAVMAVDVAWRELGGAAADVTRQIAALRSGTEKLEDDELRELGAAERALTLARAQIQSDPLGLTVHFESAILPTVNRVRATVEERIALRAQIEAALTAAHASLRDIRNRQGECSRVWSEVKEKVSGGAVAAPLPDEKMTGLGEWLDRLHERYSSGTLRPVAVGLENWNIAARSCVSDVERILSANSALLDLRKELRGRLNALKAKAQAFRVEEDAGLRALAVEAEALLYTRPTPIVRATETVGRYQSLLNERTQGGRTQGGRTAR